mgnify:CR=1 FL=1
MEKVEYYFREISKIPRGSYNEKAICDYVENFAKERNIKYVRDKMHNIVLFKEATKGYEDHETVMLEGHMDMVCEKNNDSDHDFSKDSIELIEEDGFLHANKTTLGADDGVGVCYMLALLDDESLKHPALECVFTVQEEVGLNGAMGLDKSILKAKKMIGLDRGKEKIITVSCSGGRRAVVEKELSYLKNESPCYQLYVGGLQGGHSGGVIHLERGNANVIMTRVYYHLSLNNIEFLLGSFKGGLKDNAIPRECVSVFASNDDFKKIKEVVLKVENDLKEELKESDEHVFVRLEKVDSLNEVISVKESQDIISMMYLIKKMKNVYPVFFTKTNEDILVEVPDFGILTEGKDMNDAMNMARDAIELKCVSMEDDKEEIPTPSELKELNPANGTFADDGETVVSFVDIDSTLYRKKIDTKTVRRNVALPSWLNYAADQAGINVSRILQEALMRTLKVENRM